MKEHEEESIITRDIQRRNGMIFVAIQLLIYFAAPVLYVGVVQASFMDKLGTSATIANLPASMFLLGGVLPIFSAWIVPAKHEQTVVGGAFASLAGSIVLVCLVVFLPVPGWIRIAVIIAQSLLTGMLGGVTGIYVFKCLTRGTTEGTRTWALTYGFGFGPIAALGGSMLSQFLLSADGPFLTFPFNFGILYAVSLPCMVGCIVLVKRFNLPQVIETEQRPNFVMFWSKGIKEFFRDPRLASAWMAFLLWYTALSVMGNLSLSTKVAVGRAPMELAGIILGIRFGAKALAGFGIGSVAQRYGARLAMITTVVLVGMGGAWALFSSGYWYLLAFGLLGAGELGGVYFLNYIASLSSPSVATRNLALLSIAGPLSSLAPALHGRLADQYGFDVSFAASSTAAIAALIILVVVWQMTRRSKTWGSTR